MAIAGSTIVCRLRADFGSTSCTDVFSFAG
jgi:hypothetical protein